MPVSGHTETGRISIHSLAIHDDDLVNYEKNEPLKISDIKPETRIYFKPNQDNRPFTVLLLALGFLIILAGAILAGIFAGKRRKKETVDTI